MTKTDRDYEKRIFENVVRSIDLGHRTCPCNRRPLRRVNMELLKFPNPHLFLVMPEVTVFGEELSVLLDGMWDLMKYKNGLGLAANQVGLSFRMIVMQVPNGRLNMVNPIIASKSLKPANLKEGCLSAPGDFVMVPSRPEWVQVKFQDEKGISQLVTLKGLYAVCIEHEI